MPPSKGATKFNAANHHCVSPFSSFLPKNNQKAILGPRSLAGFIDAPVLPPNAIITHAISNPTNIPLLLLLIALFSLLIPRMQKTNKKVQTNSVIKLKTCFLLYYPQVANTLRLTSKASVS